MDKRDLIALRDTVTLDPELKSGLRWAIKRIEDLESDLREADVLAKGIRRIVTDSRCWSL